MHETVGRALFHIKIVKAEGRGAPLEDEVDKMCTRP